MNALRSRSRMAAARSIEQLLYGLPIVVRGSGACDASRS